MDYYRHHCFYYIWQKTTKHNENNGKTFANFRHGLKGVEEEVKDVKQIKNDIDIITKLKIG